MDNINRLITEKFKIGFEFEFYVKNSAIENYLNLKNDKKIQKIPKEILNKYGHLFQHKIKTNNFDYRIAGEYFKFKLQKIYPNEIWNNAFSVTEDGSLRYIDSTTPLELVYKHQFSHDALRQLKQILSVLQSPDFITTTNCGLHINISFIDVSKNTKDFAFELSKHLDISTIKEKFGRKNNKYCEDNKKTSLDLEYAFEDTFSGNGFRNLLTGGKKETLGNILEGIEKLKKPDRFKMFLNMIESSVKDSCIDTWRDNRPAIAPRKSSSGNYIEFRATGGKNYQHRQEDIINTINEYLKSMLATEKSLSKQKMKVSI